MELLSFITAFTEPHPNISKYSDETCIVTVHGPQYDTPTLPITDGTVIVFSTRQKLHVANQNVKYKGLL